MFPPMEYRLMPFKLPMIQYSMDASCFSGSASSFRKMRVVWAKLCTAIPANTIPLPSCPAVRDASISARTTEPRAPANADAVTAIEPDRNRMPNAAPALAPEDTPMISGDANGFRNTVWKTKPATPRTKPPIQPTIPRLARNVTNTCHCLGSPDIIPESVSG